jgi:hypothetical protein
MTPFERQLQQAMARQEPPPDFTSKVLAAANQQQEQSSAAVWRGWIRWVYRWPLIPALAALLMMAAGIVHMEREQIARGEEAKEKLMLAMHIAGSRLNDTRHRVLEMGLAKEQQ